MKSVARACALTLKRAVIVSAFLCAAAAAAPAQPAAAPTRDEKWRQDLRQLAEEWPREHLNLFFRLRREEFERMVAELDRAIPSLRDHEIVVAMVRLGGAVGDAHSGIGWQFPRRFPLGLTWFKDGLYVTRATPAYKQHLGSRVVKIGDTDTE